MIHNALKAGITASYVLMDTWFTTEPFIVRVPEEGLDVIGMLKDLKQGYYYNGQKYNLKQLGKLVSFSKPGEILYSICVKTGKTETPVKLVFVRSRNKRSEYIVILSTDCSLSNEEIVRLYGNRWSIELFSVPANPFWILGQNFRA